MDFFLYICVLTIWSSLIVQKMGPRKNLKNIDNKKKNILKIYLSIWIIVGALVAVYTYYAVTHSHFTQRFIYVVILQSVAIIMGIIYMLLTVTFTKINKVEKTDV